MSSNLYNLYQYIAHAATFVITMLLIFFALTVTFLLCYKFTIIVVFFQSFLCAIFLSPTVKKINSLHNLSNGCCTLCILVESRNCGIKFGLSATTCTVYCDFYNDVVLSKEVKGPVKMGSLRA